MDNICYKAKFTVDYQGLTQYLTAPLPKLMSYLQEAAIRHSEDAGLTMDWFFKEMTGWVVLNWNIEILTVPKWLDTVIVNTAPAKFKGILAHRGFEVLDCDNNVILRASSQWVYTSRKNRRPIHIPSDMPAKYGELLPLPLPPEFKLPDVTNYSQFSCASHTVTRRDIDTNRHVNNISYIDWAMDNIHDDIYNNKNITQCKITYKKECILGSVVNIKTYVKENNVITHITDTENNLIAEIYTQWN